MTLATCLLTFINAHNDGTPWPRARLSDDRSCIVVKSSVILPSGEIQTVTDYVSTFHEAYNLLEFRP